MPQAIPGPLGGNRTTKVIRERGFTYEQRFVNCHKANCKRCNGHHGAVLGHGPYWYACITVRGRWKRLYLGKDLDTARYRLANGEPDWDAIRFSGRRAKQQPITMDTSPPAAPDEPATPLTDDTPPPPDPPAPYCYVCGSPMDATEADRTDPPAANLCTNCHDHGHHPDGQEPVAALPAPPGPDTPANGR